MSILAAGIALIMFASLVFVVAFGNQNRLRQRLNSLSESHEIASLRTRKRRQLHFGVGGAIAIVAISGFVIRAIGPVDALEAIELLLVAALMSLIVTAYVAWLWLRLLRHSSDDGEDKV